MFQRDHARISKLVSSFCNICDKCLVHTYYNTVTHDFACCLQVRERRVYTDNARRLRDKKEFKKFVPDNPDWKEQVLAHYHVSVTSLYDNFVICFVLHQLGNYLQALIICLQTPRSGESGSGAEATDGEEETSGETAVASGEGAREEPGEGPS